MAVYDDDMNDYEDCRVVRLLKLHIIVFLFDSLLFV